MAEQGQGRSLLDDLTSRGAMGGNVQASDPQQKPEDLSDYKNKLFDQLVQWFDTMLGPKFSGLLKTGIFANLDFQKAAIQVNKEINQASIVKGAQGGVLANIVFGEVFKPSGAPSSSAPSGGDSGGWGGGGDYTSSGGGFADYSALAAPSHSYDWAPVSMAMLGEFSPPMVGGRGPAIASDMGLG